MTCVFIDILNLFKNVVRFDNDNGKLIRFGINPQQCPVRVKSHQFVAIVMTNTVS